MRTEIVRDEKLWFTRRNLPPEYRNTTDWPQIDMSNLDDAKRSIIARRQRALEAYLVNHPLAEIHRECQVSTATMIRLLNRCLTTHPDGRLYGWRAILPTLHIKQYVRTARVMERSDGKGLVGAFKQFIRDHPDIQEALDTAIRKTRDDRAPVESRLSQRSLYHRFRRLCIEGKISDTQYPFNTADEGRRSLGRYVRHFLLTHFAVGARRLGGPTAQMRARTGTGHEAHEHSFAPFDVCSIDAFMVPALAVVAIPVGSLFDYVLISRVHIIPVVEHDSGAALGYTVAIGKQPSGFQAARAIKNALSVSAPRKLSVPGLEYRKGAMMPSYALPALEGLGWAQMLLDNASIHYSNVIKDRIRQRVGCAINYGPPGHWFRRPEVESFFSALQTKFFIRLPNSTGFNPKDPLRPDAAKEAMKHVIALEEYLDLIDLAICEVNGTPRDSLRNRSPLERLADRLEHTEGHWLPRRLAPLTPSMADLDTEVLSRTIRGEVSVGRRPYIHLEGVNYTSPVLAQAGALIGQQITVHIKDEDLRSVMAFLPNGAELGPLVAQGAWSRTRHNRPLRREILKALKHRELVVDPDQDLVVEYLAQKTRAVQHALEQQKKASRPRISNDATTLAKSVEVVQKPLSEIIQEARGSDEKPTHSSQRKPAMSPLIPRMTHRGSLK